MAPMGWASQQRANAPSEAEKKSECAKNGKNASIEVSPEALGRVLRAHLMPAHPPTQRLGRFRVLILSFLRSGLLGRIPYVQARLDARGRSERLFVGNLIVQAAQLLLAHFLAH